MPSIDFLCVVGHAPHMGYPKDQIQAWWRKLSVYVHKYGQGLPVVCMLDANAAVGEVLSEHVGDSQPEAENFAGSCFHSFLAQVGHIAVNAMPQLQRGCGRTFVHSTGRESR
jgi:hypothetical protein